MTVSFSRRTLIHSLLIAKYIKRFSYFIFLDGYQKSAKKRLRAKFTHLAGGSDNADCSLLSRSKSASSVTNLGTAVTNVGTSSLSLNDVEVLEQAEAVALEGTSTL
jgi:hypothetical protein